MHVLTINEATCWRCGHPRGECTCQPVQNDADIDDDDDDDDDEGDDEEDDDDVEDDEDEDAEDEDEDEEGLLSDYAELASMEPAERRAALERYTEDELDRLIQISKQETAMVTNEERLLGSPTWGFTPSGPTANQKQRPAPTVRQQYPIVANDGEETPLGCPTWNFAPSHDDRPDESELVANDDHEQPMPSRTWRF